MHIGNGMLHSRVLFEEEVQKYISLAAERVMTFVQMLKDTPFQTHLKRPIQDLRGGGVHLTILFSLFRYLIYYYALNFHPNHLEYVLSEILWRFKGIFRKNSTFYHVWGIPRRFFFSIFFFGIPSKIPKPQY